jgi:hypothetical protein
LVVAPPHVGSYPALDVRLLAGTSLFPRQSSVMLTPLTMALLMATLLLASAHHGSYRMPCGMDPQ